MVVVDAPAPTTAAEWIIDRRSSGRRFGLAHPGAVGGGADGVGDADAALGGDAGGLADVEAADATGGVLEAVAGGAPVGGGAGGGVEAPDAAAAACGGSRALAAGVGQAGPDGGAHLTACHGGLRGRRRQHHRRHDGDRHSKLHAASHVDLDRPPVIYVLMLVGD